MSNRFIIIISYCLWFSVSAVKANDSLLINRLVDDIASMQYDKESQYGFHKGMFYSYKKWAGYPQRYTPDNNIFYTGIIAFALQNMFPKLSERNKKICAAIIKDAASAYPYYQNKKGLPTYFFWQGGKPIMPNTLIAQKLSGLLATSEDIDDSVMLLMAMEAGDSSYFRLKQVMDSVANGVRNQINNTYKKYKNTQAHTTYLGKKMRVDFDLAVQCNVLYFLLEKKIPFNHYDSATLEIVTGMIKDRAYKKDPKYVAPYYISTPVILYHISRLIGKFNIASLQPYRQQLINDIRKELNRTNNIMDEIILSTSLLRLGEKTDQLEISNMEDFNNSNQEQFVFFQARAASQMRNPFKRLFMNFSMFNYHFFCPAYNKVLLLEHLVARS